MYKKGLYKIRIGAKEKDILEQFSSLSKAEIALSDYQRSWKNAWIEHP